MEPRDEDERLRNIRGTEWERDGRRDSGRETGRGKSERDDSDVTDNGFTAQIQNVGGSLKVLLQIALLAWGVRQLRSVLAKRRSAAQEPSAAGSSAPAFATLSPAAVHMLVALRPLPCSVVDVRASEAARAAPAPIEDAINIPDVSLRESLQLSPEQWEERFPNAAQPKRRELLVVVSTRGRRARQAAAAAASVGFSRCCVLSGGIQGYNTFADSPSGPPPKVLSRDALALLLDIWAGEDADEQSVGSSRPILVDLRRHDERALYGHIPGSVHLPVDQWPKALAMGADAWEQQYHFPKISRDDLVILQSRGRKRALWAAQLAADAGLKRCFVYGQGSFGWRLDSSVMAYYSYQEGGAPPTPLPFDLENIDEETAEQELQSLGLLTISDE